MMQGPSALKVIRPKLFEGMQGVIAGMSTRHGGVSPYPLGMNVSFKVGDDEQNVVRNRTIFFTSIGKMERDVAFAGQCHSAKVVVVHHAGMHAACDALVTNTPGVMLAISVADCTPILLFDPKRRVVASVHAGWRGTHARISVQAVNCMKVTFQCEPSDIMAYIGPCAGPCCYEVGKEVGTVFEPTVVRTVGEKSMLDLPLANRRQLMLAGLHEKRIEVDGRCTICGDEDFHSFRRDGNASGRMLACIGLEHSEKS